MKSSSFGSPLARSYQHCARITRQASSTFSLATWLFDTDTRRSIRALYAFCRIADDIADSTTLTTRQKQRGLKSLRQAITTRQASRVGQDIWPALFDTIQRHNLPVSELELILDGVASDITFHQPLTIAELDRYSYLVAGIVGVLSARILGGYKKSTLLGAKQLGIAMQYTNIIRDVAADSEQGRIYIPQSILRDAELTPEQLKQRTNQAGLQRALTVMANRAETYYIHSESAILDLHPSYQKAVRVASALYKSILDRVKQKQYTVYSGRIRLTALEKIIVALQA